MLLPTTLKTHKILNRLENASCDFQIAIYSLVHAALQLMMCRYIMHPINIIIIIIIIQMRYDRII